MTLLEKKVDTLIRLCLTNDPCEQEQYKKELRKLITGKATIGTIREEAAALLMQIGVSSHLMGYTYALEAICVAAEDADAAKHGNMAALYEKVAKVCGTRPARVERCIRHAVERCFDNCDPDMISQYFGGTVSPDKGKLTCSEFVAGCARIVRDRIEGGNTCTSESVPTAGPT